MQGTYYGLVAPTDHNNITVSNAGLAKITSTSLGTFSGTLSMQGKLLPFAGKWDYAGQARNISIPRLGTTPLTANLSIDLSNNLGNDHWHRRDRRLAIGHHASRQVTKLTTNSIPAAHAFTMKIPSQSSDLGDSFATITASSLGLLTLRGTMADNTPWTESVGVAKDGKLPDLLVPLHRPRPRHRPATILVLDIVPGRDALDSSRNFKRVLHKWILTPAFYGYISSYNKPAANSTYTLRFGSSALTEVAYHLKANTLGQLLVTSGPTNKLASLSPQQPAH